MKVLSYILPLLQLSIGSSTSTRIPVLVNEYGSSYVVIGIGEHRFGLESSFRPLTLRRARVDHLIRMRTSDRSEFTFVHSSSYDQNTLRDRDALCVGFYSDFSEALNSMLIVPTDSACAPVDLVLNPQDPHASCIDRNLTYLNIEQVPTVRGPDSGQYFGVHGSLSIPGLSEFEQLFFVFDLSESSPRSVPALVYDSVAQIIQSNGGLLENRYLGAPSYFLPRESMRYSQVSLQNCMSTLIPVLPDITLTLFNSPPSQTKINIVLTPEDYVKPVRRDPHTCQLMLNPKWPVSDGSDNIVVRLTLLELKLLVTHFDYANDRIGIGEPL